MTDGSSKGPDFSWSGDSQPSFSGPPPQQPQGWAAPTQPGQSFGPQQPQFPASAPLTPAPHGPGGPPPQGQQPIPQQSHPRHGNGRPRWLVPTIIILTIALVAALAVVVVPRFLYDPFIDEVVPDYFANATLGVDRGDYLHHSYADGARPIQVPKSKALGVSQDEKTVALWSFSRDDGTQPDYGAVYDGLMLVDVATAEVKGERPSFEMCSRGFAFDNRLVCSTGTPGDLDVVADGTRVLTDYDVNTGESTFEIELQDHFVNDITVVGVLQGHTIIHVDHRPAGQEGPSELLSINDDGSLNWRVDVQGRYCAVRDVAVTCSTSGDPDIDIVVEFVDSAGEMTTTELGQDILMPSTTMDGSIIVFAVGDNERFGAGNHVLDKNGNVQESEVSLARTLPEWRPNQNAGLPLSLITEETWEFDSISVLSPQGEEVAKAVGTEEYYVRDWTFGEGEAQRINGEPRGVTPDGRVIAVAQELGDDDAQLALVNIEDGTEIATHRADYATISGRLEEGLFFDYDNAGYSLLFVPGAGVE